MSEKKIANIATPCFKNICSQLSIICKTDKISSIQGWNRIVKEPRIIDAMQMLKEGQTVGQQGTTSSMFARLHIVVDSIDELNDICDMIYSSLRVTNDKGEDMVIRVN